MRGVQVLKASMSRTERARAIAAFRLGTARVMVMDAVGSVGLDLSFAQHVFLMEPLGDLSLEQQIVSRAHRLGATRAVHAEILVMKVRLALSRGRALAHQCMRMCWGWLGRA